jgi:CIC family chloride channel protein
VTRTRAPQLLFANDSLAQAVRQLVLYGRDGLPVGSTDGQAVAGWLTNQSVLRAVARQLAAAEPDIAAGARAAEWADPHAGTTGHDPHAELPGYRIVERTLNQNSTATGRTLGDLDWPASHLPVSVLHNRRLIDADPTIRLAAGDRVSFLEPDHAATVEASEASA